MSSQSNSRADVYQVVTDRIINMLEQGTAPWRKPWTGGSDGMPANLISKKAYTGINPFLLCAAPFDSRWWLTYKQAQDLGGHVKKGEKGSPIVFCKTYQKEVKSSDSSESRLETRVAVRYYTIFNVEQCEGIDYTAPQIKTFPENQQIEAAEQIQLCMPRRPSVEFGGSAAYYVPSTDRVKIPSLDRFERPQEFYSILFHELAHSTGHESRLNRPSVVEQHRFGDAVYSKEELIAEMTAAFLCAHYGIENQTLDNSAAYIQGWIKTLHSDKKLAVQAAAQAQKAANYILNIKPEAESEAE